MATEQHLVELSEKIREEHAAISYRTAVIPLAVYVGAAIRNSGTILIEFAPWFYLGFVVILQAVVQQMQRKQHKAWPWSLSLIVGFGIAAIAILGSVTIVYFIAPLELKPN